MKPKLAIRITAHNRNFHKMENAANTLALQFKAEKVGKKNLKGISLVFQAVQNKTIMMKKERVIKEKQKRQEASVNNKRSL